MENGWDEERFMAQLEVGRLAMRLEHSEAVVLGELLAAYRLRPKRAEPLFELSCYFRARHSYAMATLFAKAGVQTPRPEDRLFVVESVYTWQLLDELGVAAFWTEDYATCQRACQAVIERAERGHAVPESDLQRITHNLALAKERLGPR